MTRNENNTKANRFSIRLSVFATHENKPWPTDEKEMRRRKEKMIETNRASEHVKYLQLNYCFYLRAFRAYAK